jgi:hypothetical protein
VTGGILRGEKARFQLFGDTMNTASRMESTSLPNRIQVSQETADLLESAGKGGWVKQREDKIVAKGKGHLTTYWLDLRRRSATRSVGSGSGSDTNSNADEALLMDFDVDRSFILDHLPENIRRLVEWNCEVLFNLLQKITMQRKRLGTLAESREAVAMLEQEFKSKANATVIDEVEDIIMLPVVHCTEESLESNEECIIDDKVKQQLRMYLGRVAAMYRDNPFHNFEHASVSITHTLHNYVLKTNLTIHLFCA